MAKPWNRLPEQFLERLEMIIPKTHYQEVCASFAAKRPTTIRTNTIKITSQKLHDALTALGVTLEPVSWYKDAWIVSAKELRELTALQSYSDGLLYVQSLSSMIPPLVLSPQKGETVLDLCAAPGSKTTQMAAMMENSGSIIASDNSRIRMYRLEANCKTQGVTNVKTLYAHGQILWQTYPEYFDKTLVDVPCSMEGRFQCDDPKTYAHWSHAKVKELAERQKWLLRGAISATKPGGIIVYSTCTLSPEENENIIDWIYKKEKGSISIEPIAVPGCPFAEPLLQWKEKTYDASIKNTARIFPSDIMEGFFVAKIKKHRSTVRHHDVQSVA